MIYDNLNNIDLYKGLSDDIYVGLEFLKKVDPSIAKGVYQLNPRLKAIVSEYETKTCNNYVYETHKRFIDIQYTLKGLERIACLPVEKLEGLKAYSEDSDAALYVANSKPQEMVIGDGFFAVFFPQDGHMPQICVDTPSLVKKVVIKVEIVRGLV